MTPWVPPPAEPPPPPLDPGWVPADAWALAAIRVSGTPTEPARLLDVIVAADALNGVILSRAEIEHAVGRLLAAGLILVDDRGFATTQEGRALVAQARGGRVPRLEALFALVGRLEVEPWLWTVDEREYEAATLEYRHTVFEGYRRETRKLWRRGF